MLSLRRAASVALLGLAAGCVTEPPPPSGSVELTVGTVDAAGAGFLSMAGDQPLVPGAQGGFHVWLKYRVKDYVPGTYVVRREVRRAGDAKLVLRPTDTPVELGEPDPSGSWELPAPLPSFMCPTPIGVEVRDQSVRFKIQLLDPETLEVMAEGTAVATPRCPPEGDPQRAFCERICSG